jgi:hypothetical protein
MRNLFDLLFSWIVGCLSFQFLFGEVHNLTFRRVKIQFHINAPYLSRSWWSDVLALREVKKSVQFRIVGKECERRVCLYVILNVIAVYQKQKWTKYGALLYARCNREPVGTHAMKKYTLLSINQVASKPCKERPANSGMLFTDRTILSLEISFQADLTFLNILSLCCIILRLWGISPKILLFINLYGFRTNLKIKSRAQEITLKPNIIK